LTVDAHAGPTPGAGRHASATVRRASAPVRRFGLEESFAPLFVAYVPGLDARRIDRERTPFLRDLRAKFPPVGLRTLPSTELLPTLLTGVPPHQHGIWQVRLRPDAWTRRPRLIDRLPEILGTTLQCLRQLTDHGYDLAAVPPRRRRQFELLRFKYTRRERDGAVMGTIGASPSLLGLLGERGRYLFTRSFSAFEGLGRDLPTGRFDLEFLEMYALDLFQHWHMDRPAALDDAYRRTDAFLRTLESNARSRGVRFMVLVDHGQEPVTGDIPLRQAVDAAAVAADEYTMFIEAAMARFWFRTDRARERIGEALARLPHARSLGWRELAAYGIAFDDSAHGELYVSADPGRVFFPHDFYQPVANLFLGVTDRHQRPRLLRPRHRGNHGYLPEHASERGWLVLADAAWRASRDEMTLLDFAPTVLALLGRAPPAAMRGAPVFATAEPAPAAR
jgi:hypothetical protein